MAAGASAHRQQRFLAAVQIGVLLLARSVPSSSRSVRRSETGQRLRGHHRVLIGGTGNARPRRSELILSVARMLLRTGVGAGAVGERVLGSGAEDPRRRGRCSENRASGREGDACFARGRWALGVRELSRSGKLLSRRKGPNAHRPPPNARARSARQLLNAFSASASL